MRRPAPESHPFGEPAAVRRSRSRHLLGTQFRFESDSPRLLSLVDEAYDGLPPQRWPVVARPVQLRLRLVPDASDARWDTPPPPRTLAGGGLVCGICDAANYAVLSPAARTGLVVLSPRMLRHRYHARYELLEFAVFTLAARVRGLVSLHAGCLARGDRVLALIGGSGAGKSTAALAALAAGLEFMSEDSTFVCPESLLATGVPNFLHLRSEVPALIAEPRLRTLIRRSPRIRRRNGAQKFEVDARRTGLRLARAPGRLAALVFLSPRAARAGAELRPLGRREALARLEAAQSFEALQPGWAEFRRRVAALPAFELRRGPTLASAATALCRALEARRP